MSYALGWLLISGDVLWSVLLAYDSEHKLINGVARKMGTTILVSALLIGFAATTVFPWNAQLGVLNKAIGFLASIQFPWRLLGLTSFLLVVVSCLVVHAVLSMKEWLNLIIGVFFAFCLLPAGYAIDSFLQNNEPLSEFTVDIDPVADGVAGGEYLPQGTNLESLLNSDAAPSDITGEVEVLTYERKGTSVSLSIHSHSDEQQTILLPLLYYRNYVLTSEESSESCEMQVGDNNRTELVIPPHFEGTVQVYYSVPMVWRVASLVSFATFVALMLSF